MSENLRAAIAAIARDNPDLCSRGWYSPRERHHLSDFEKYRGELLTDDFARQVVDSLVDLASKRPRTGSYGQKHRTEARCGRYVSNGAAIVALCLSGYRIMRDWGGPNCTYSRPREIEPHQAFRGPACHDYVG